jgi:hypothetical protein
MAKQRQNTRLAFGADIEDPQDMIHMGVGKRIRLEDVPLSNSTGDKQVGNRRYNDLRYLLRSEDGSASDVTNYELIITSPTTGIASVSWIDGDNESNVVTDQAVTFPGLPSEDNFRIDLLQAHDDGTISIKPGTEGDELGVTPPAPDANAIGVTTVLWNDAGDAIQPEPAPANNNFTNKRYTTKADPNTTGKYAKVWEGKLSSTDNYGIIIDYQEPVNAVNFDGVGAARVQVSWTADSSRNIIADTVQFETLGSKTADGDFVLVQIAGNKAALYHKSAHYWGRIQFRATFHNSAVKANNFVNNGVYGSLPAGTSYASEAYSSEGTPGPAGADGEDGREIEIQNSGTAIQWRYVGDPTWTDIVTIAAITGPAGADGTDGTNGADGNDGADGREAEFQVSGTDLQYRLVGDPTWTTIFDLSTLSGGGIGEAPNDGQEYVRKNEAWAVATGGSGGGITEVPFTTALKLDKNYKSKTTQTGALAFTKDATDLVPETHYDNRYYIYIEANGTGGKPTFSSDFVLQLDTWSNNTGDINMLLVRLSSSGKYLVWMDNVEIA